MIFKKSKKYSCLFKLFRAVHKLKSNHKGNIPFLKATSMSVNIKYSVFAFTSPKHVIGNHYPWAANNFLCFALGQTLLSLHTKSLLSHWKLKAILYFAHTGDLLNVD